MKIAMENKKTIIMNKKEKEIPRIRVAVRKRPLNSKELQKNDIDIVEITPPHSLIVKELK